MLTWKWRRRRVRDPLDWAAADDIDFGRLKKRHGAILPITEAEYEAIEGHLRQLIRAIDETHHADGTDRRPPPAPSSATASSPANPPASLRVERRAGKASRYWVGVRPVRRLKTRMKYLGSSYPTSAAISVTAGGGGRQQFARPIDPVFGDLFGDADANTRRYSEVR